MIVARDVATAMCIRTEASTPTMARAASSAGTMTMPPPMPSKPARTPATAPVRIMATIKLSNSIDQTVSFAT